MPLTAPSLEAVSVCAYGVLLLHNVKSLESEILVLVLLDRLGMVGGSRMGSK